MKQQEENNYNTNCQLYAAEMDDDFDLQYFQGQEMYNKHRHLYGHISFFMGQCPECGDTMPFEFDEGVCMKCSCDPCEGIVDEMTEEEWDELVKDNRYHMEIPFLRRMPFETLPQLIERQVEFRLQSAIDKQRATDLTTPVMEKSSLSANKMKKKKERVAELLSMLDTDDSLTVRNIVHNCPIICLFALEATKGTKCHSDAEEMVRTIYPNWPDVTLK